MLGRGHESDVRIADVSISRCHATISFVRGQFVLEDNNSKFGTLVAMKKPRQLDANSPTSIQMGRTVLSLSLQAPPDQVNSTPSLNQLPGSNAQDERNLRLSLLTRTSRGDNSMNASEWMRGGDQSSVDGDPLVDGSLRDHEATL
jgi:predicted component of type VI protein secretion system